MKVLIITEGSRSTGFGHITRCMSLCQAFEERGIKPLFVINGDETATSFLKGRDHVVFNWLTDGKRLFDMMDGSADAVIIDSYLADIRIYQKIPYVTRSPFYIDDNIRLDYPSGTVVNGTIYSEEMGYPERAGVSYLLGVKYVSLRKEFWDAPAKDIGDHIERIMITFGGDDGVNMTPKVLRLLQDNYPRLIKRVIIGKGFSNIERIERLADETTELVYYPDASEMKSAMLKSDIAISAGGQTLCELARMGTPSISIAVADNQLNNTAGWQRAGFADCAGWWEDQGFEGSILRAIKNLEGKKTRAERSRIGQDFVDGRGSRRIVERLLKGK